MKKFLTLTIISIIALIGLTVSVNAADVSTKEELQAALTGTETNVRIMGNIDLEKTTLIVDKEVTVDLNGYQIKGPDDGKANWYAFIVKENGILTLRDTSAAQTGEIFARCYGVETKGGTFIMESGKIIATNNTTFGAAVVNYGGKVEIKEGTLIADIWAVEAEAYFADAEVVISGGTFETTEAQEYSVSVQIGGQYSEKTETVIISGGTFKGTNAFAVDTNADVSITGGKFYQDVSEYVPVGYIADEIAADLGLYEVKLNRPHVTPDTLTGDSGEIEMKVGKDLEGELEAIFEKEININEKLKEALDAGREVRIDVQLKRLEEDKIKAEEIKALKEAAKEGKFVKFYDITLVMIADKTENLGAIPEISNNLTFKVLVPEELVRDGRTFFMYRYHEGANGGEVEKLTGELDEENYFTFESDRFSTYALAYEDKVDEPAAGGQGTAETEKDETPKTGSVDVVLFASAMVAVISIAGIVTVKKYTR